MAPLYRTISINDKIYLILLDKNKSNFETLLSTYENIQTLYLTAFNSLLINNKTMKSVKNIIRSNRARTYKNISRLFLSKFEINSLMVENNQSDEKILIKQSNVKSIKIKNNTKLRLVINDSTVETLTYENLLNTSMDNYISLENTNVKRLSLNNFHGDFYIDFCRINGKISNSTLNLSSLSMENVSGLIELENCKICISSSQQYKVSKSILYFQPNIGSRNDTLLSFKDEENNLIFKTGCFIGAKDKFKREVRSTYSKTELYGKQYLSAIKIAKIYHRI